MGHNIDWANPDRGTLPSAVVILRDKTEEHPLHQVWSNIPEWSSKLMIELGWNLPNDISSGQMI